MFRVEFIKTNHSIQDAAALAIYSPAIVVHTGDFKIDYTPVFGDAIDSKRFGEIGKKEYLHFFVIVQMQKDLVRHSRKNQ